MAIQEDLSRNFGFILHDVARLLRTNFDRRVKGMGLTRSQWWVLLHVYRHDGVSQSELADILEIEKATLGRLVDRLESNGWLHRENDGVDRRVKRIFLTDAVQPAMKAMRDVAADVRREALSGLTVAGQERFVDILLSVKTNLSRSENGANGGKHTQREVPKRTSGVNAKAKSLP